MFGQFGERGQVYFKNKWKAYKLEIMFKLIIVWLQMCVHVRDDS